MDLNELEYHSEDWFQGPEQRPCEDSNETLGCIKGRKYLPIPGRLPVSQEGLLLHLV
jgi:hypothetical protein